MPAGRDRNGAAAGEAARVVRLADLEMAALERWKSGMEEFDFVLGGGIVPGSVVLIGGEPGIGKSTLLLQIAARLAEDGRNVLYVAGEESVGQVRMRADRLAETAGDVRILATTDLDAILSRSEQAAPHVLLVDSIQTVYSAGVDGAPGSVTQVRECAAQLQRYAKLSGAAVFLVGHVTKGGGLAGPKTLEHIVDTVLYFQSAAGADHRILRAAKNRFGSVDELGVFRMSATGLIAIANPSELFLGDRDAVRPGSAVTSTIEGSRPLVVEIQALATRAPYGAPQRVASGFEHKRLALLLAVLEKRAGLPFGHLDVFLNVVGGLRILETTADAAVAVALASTVRDAPVRANTLIVGEIGLGGELRPVGHIDRRLAEAARLGFTTAIVPPNCRLADANASLRLSEAADVLTLLEKALV